jgi:hypothetical protein
VKVVLHEDGPTFQFVVEQIPNFLSAASALFTAWVAWRSKRPKESGTPEPRRTARIEIGEHHYHGPATDAEQLETILRALVAIDSSKRES